MLHECIILRIDGLLRLFKLFYQLKQKVIFSNFLAGITVCDYFLHLIIKYIDQDDLLSDLLESFLLIFCWFDDRLFLFLLGFLRLFVLL